ncbi:MAG: glycosyltransferase family 4 protein [Bacteroidia bacterium]|nr:glycosyltransferase family 4 protein [Bacteroidia bacterium]
MKKIIKRILKFIGIYKYFTIVYDNLYLFFLFINCSVKIIFLSKKYQRFLFFPHYCTGGAQQVHIDIVKAIKSLKPVVFITSDSNNTHFRDDFYKYSKCFEILPFIKIRAYNKILSYVIIKTINSRKNACTFGSNSQFYYQILPNLNSQRIKRIDLLHAFTHANEPGAEKWSLPFLKYLDSRVVISQHLKKLVVQQYIENRVDMLEKNKIIVINNKTDVPKEYQTKNFENSINILFIGRNSKEKRLSIILEIAKKVKLINDIKFYFAGFDFKEIDNEILNLQNCIFIGAIEDKDKIAELYTKSHILLLSSSREGFPMVIMEALCYGVVPITTDVGAIPDFIQDGFNGFLYNANESEEVLINKMSKKIQYLYRRRDELKSLSKNCYNFTKKEFLNNDFENLYLKLFK